MPKQAILCVDDEAIILLSVKQELQSHFKERFLYETALNAREALAIIDELSAEGIVFILVISDWLMPGMSGDEFLAKVKGSHPEIKTILLTGHASSDSIERMQREELTDSIILKPWKRNELIQKVEALVGPATP
jgi:DNA-binding NtrC family response regulator